VGAYYIGRFAPSPTGPLHAGSLVAALASWLDARAHNGRWLVRIEDVDTPRCVPGADHIILQQLVQCGLVPDEPPVYQSQRSAHYQAALDQLRSAQLVYPCTCSRSDIETVWRARGLTKPRHGELIYPGTCRHHSDESAHFKRTAASRFKTDFLLSNQPIVQAFNAQTAINSIANTRAPSRDDVEWTDRRLGPQTQAVATTVGDFVLRRADGLWAYQLAVVVDDALQGITQVVRGEDLADNTARQILLQRALGYATPQYLHTPLVLAADGQKLSKQNGAQALQLGSTEAACSALKQAATVLKLNPNRYSNANKSNYLEQLLPSLLTQWKTTHHLSKHNITM
jgi:glutamyl-Q tRNA(Asp) synthetase